MTYGRFSQHPVRLRSPEVDFGVHWRGRAHDMWRWRISWIEATGEVYAVRLHPSQASQEVEILGRAPDREAAEAALRGWEDVCGEPESLAWARAAMARLKDEEAPDAHLEGDFEDRVSGAGDV